MSGPKRRHHQRHKSKSFEKIIKFLLFFNKSLYLCNKSTCFLYSQFYVYIPFRADIEMCITAPKGTSSDDIYLFYDEKIEPVLADMCGLTCSLSKMSIKFDSNIQRLVLTAKLSASGITKIERSSP